MCTTRWLLTGGGICTILQSPPPLSVCLCVCVRACVLVRVRVRVCDVLGGIIFRCDCTVLNGCRPMSSTR